MILNNNILGVPFIQQKGSSWCWATCIEMFFKYYNFNATKNITACEIVSKFLNKESPEATLNCQNCLQADGEIHPDCDKAVGIEEFKNVLIDYNLNVNVLFNATWDNIVEIIHDGHPIIASMKIEDSEFNESHVVVIKGYIEQNGENYLILNNPLNEEASLKAFNIECNGNVVGTIVHFHDIECNLTDENTASHQDTSRWYSDLKSRFDNIKRPSKGNLIKHYTIPIRNIDFTKLDDRNLTISGEISPLILTENLIQEVLILDKGKSRFFGFRKIKCNEKWVDIDFYWQNEDLEKKIKFKNKTIILDNTDYNFEINPLTKEVDQITLKGEYEKLEFLPTVYEFYSFRYNGQTYLFTYQKYPLKYRKHPIQPNRVYKLDTILKSVGDSSFYDLMTTSSNPNEIETRKNLFFNKLKTKLQNETATF